MTNTTTTSDYAAEHLGNTLRDLHNTLSLYGASMPKAARADRVEHYDWSLAELVAGGHADLARQWYQRAEDADLTAWGVHYPNRATVRAASAALDLRSVAGRYTDSGDQFDDLMASPDDTRPHPDGA